MRFRSVLKRGGRAVADALVSIANRRSRQARAVLPELHNSALLAVPSLSPMVLPLMRRAIEMMPSPKIPPGVRISEHLVERGERTSGVRILIFEREASSGIKPALFWMHGGGYVIGKPEQDMAFVAHILDCLDIAIVSVDYRLAPEHPFPAPLDDCHTALCWLVGHASALGIDRSRIAIGGQSAGGGLAAALVQRVVENGPIAPVFQLLVYPMLDARTTTRRDHGDKGRLVWTPKSNLFGWASYLGRDPRIDDYPAYAVPASRVDLKGLPPAWIGVGTLDLFHDENVEYGKRLLDAGVKCFVHLTEGAYHGFDMIKPQAIATSHFNSSMVEALRKYLRMG